MPVAIFTTVHNRAGLCSAKVRQEIETKMFTILRALLLLTYFRYRDKADKNRKILNTLDFSEADMHEARLNRCNRPQIDLKQ